MLESMNPESLSPAARYERDGFAVFRNLIPQDVIQEARSHIDWLMRKYPDLRPEHYHHPLMRDDAFWVSLITHAKLLDVVERFLGPDIVCFTSHYICKPPRDGHAILWHQDAGYWKLEPIRAITLWLAVDESTIENGCLWMIPGSHKLPLCNIKVQNDQANMLNSIVDLDGLDEARASLADPSRHVPIELQPGDVSIHHPYVLHHSLPNTSDKRRCGLDIGYTDAGVHIKNQGLYENPVLCRGTPKPGINRYRAWPTYHPGASMPFRDREAWDQRAARHNRPEFAFGSPADEPVYHLVQRMMQRIQAGTVKA